MKKNLLSLAVAASAAGVASLASAQMYLNAEGTGEALVFPMYSAQGGNDTLISITNTTDQFKAVKVRMLEGQESLETLDFNLYMSPQDHFSFAITADGEGALLRTRDTSCTVPQITGDVPFTDLLWIAADAEVGSAQGREQVGYIEVIEMGQIDPDSATAADILHGDGTEGTTAGVPGDCPQLVANWSDLSADEDGEIGAWYGEADAQNVGVTGEVAGVGETDFLETWDGGGLYGVATVINVAEGTAFGYDAAAIEDLVTAGSDGFVLHYPPGDTRPDFEDDALNLTANVNVDGVQTVYTGSPIARHHAVSAVFMTQSISNDYIVDADISGLTDWIVTMPTKGNHAEKDPDDGDYFSPPFSNVSIDALDDDETETELCQPVGMTGYDREEQVQDAPPVDAGSNDTPPFSPSVRPDPEDPESVPDWALCAESSIIHFGATSATNSTSNLADAQVFVDGWAAGWAVLDLTEDGLVNGLDNERVLPGAIAGNDGELTGLPVTGFAVVKYTNGNTGGVQSNYSSAWEHKTDVATSAE
jgi:hypothetical protein